MRDYIRGTIIAGAVGDALGMPYEGLTQAEIAHHPGKVTVYKDSQHGKYTKGLKKGQFTDDTQLTLATLESVVATRKAVDIEDIGARFVELYNSKQLRAAGRSTKQALKSISKGMSASDSGVEDGYGCGAAMRMAPIGLLPVDGREGELVVADVAYITHNNSVALASSIAVAYAVGHLLGGEHPVDDWHQKQEFLGYVEHWSNYRAPSPELDFSGKVKAMKEHLNEDFEQLAGRIGTSGLATESVMLSIFSFLKEPRDFERLMEQSITCGGDTDSIAAIAGNLFGAYNGYSAIPVAYRINLEDHDRILALADKFAELLLE